MVADRVCLFPTDKENENFAAALVEICRDHPFKALVVSEAPLSRFDQFEGKPGFVIEALQQDGQKWRAAVWFTRKQFTPEKVEERVREIVQEWKKFYLKTARN